MSISKQHLRGGPGKFVSALLVLPSVILLSSQSAHGCEYHGEYFSHEQFLGMRFGGYPPPDYEFEDQADNTKSLESGSDGSAPDQNYSDGQAPNNLVVLGLEEPPSQGLQTADAETRPLPSFNSPALEAIKRARAQIAVQREVQPSDANTLVVSDKG